MSTSARKLDLLSCMGKSSPMQLFVTIQPAQNDTHIPKPACKSPLAYFYRSRSRGQHANTHVLPCIHQMSKMLLVNAYGYYLWAIFFHGWICYLLGSPVPDSA
jgi:hypothetical protein